MLCIRPQSDTAETVRLMGNSIGVKKEKKEKKMTGVLHQAAF